MKGQSFIVIHAMFVGFSVLFVLVILATFGSLKENYQDFIAKNELKEICLSVKSGIEKIYVNTAYKPLTNTTAGRLRIKLPDRVADIRYRLSFSRSTGLLTTDIFNDSCELGFSSLTGSTTGGQTEISVYLYSNNTKTIEMRKI